ncbi:exosome complex component rrp45b [Quercus suber]|uniref:Exosome complex component rrp45b n=1 Tax=Quercus suber TaxID=58331 RepID=A0AAW0M4L4_QUESU
MTATLNANNDICAIQKAGGEGVLQSRQPSSVALDISGVGVNIRKNQNKPVPQKGDNERSNLTSEKSVADQSMDIECEAKSSEQQQTNKIGGDAKNFIGGPSSWDPYSAGINSDFLQASLASRGITMPSRKEQDSKGENMSGEAKPVESPKDFNREKNTHQQTGSCEEAARSDSIMDLM